MLEAQVFRARGAGCSGVCMCLGCGGDTEEGRGGHRGGGLRGRQRLGNHGDVETGDGPVGGGKQNRGRMRGGGEAGERGSGWRSLGGEGAGAVREAPSTGGLGPGEGSQVSLGQGARGRAASTLGLPEHHLHGAGGRGPERQEWVPTQSRGLQDQDCLTPISCPQD